VEGLPDFRAPGPTALVVIDSSKTSGDDWLHLLPVGNRPMLLRVLDSLTDARVEQVALAVEPMLVPQVRRLLDGVDRSPFELTYLESSPGAGLLGSLRSAGELTADRPLLVHWGCSLFKAPLRSQLRDDPGGPFDAVLLVDVPRTESSVTQLASERLASLAGHSRSQSRGSLAGVALLGAGVREAAQEVEAGRGADAEVLAVVERMAKLGGRPTAMPAARCWRCTGAVDSALEANRFLLEDLVDEPPQSEAAPLESRGTTVQGPARIDPSVMLERSTVRGPVVIGPRARLCDAYIGPYTSIGADVRVEGAEIENSIVLDDTRVCHVGRRMDASVVGPGATICRDFRLPAALRLQVGEGAQVSLS
jgi:glucose-1-phosphate thymidylyltransferase